MSALAVHPHQYEEDRALTLRNRARLDANKNLLYWYGKLYVEQFGSIDPTKSRVLEIGSGVSPLKRFYASVLTSDVLDLDYLDYVFDCHDIDQFDPIADESLDVIAMTNVLHHLRDPIEFLGKAALKLKPGGRIIATEPYFSTLSTLIFKYLHHEPVDFAIDEPVLSEVRGPLSSANIALPWLIFVRRLNWRERLRSNYDVDNENFRPFSFISYMATGGISHQLPVPAIIYRAFFQVDMMLSRLWPRMFASFFTITLVRK
jgi:SAM-dependent methyltransferase